MLKSILVESQLFSRNTDQLHELAQADQVGIFITNMPPVFRQLTEGIAAIETTLTQLLKDGQGGGLNAGLAEFHIIAVRIQKRVSEAYSEYLDTTQTRALDAIA